MSRFFDEARATARLRHPGIVEVLDCAVHSNGGAYIVLEYLDGETLGDYMARAGSLRESPRLVAALTAQIAPGQGPVVVVTAEMDRALVGGLRRLPDDEAYDRRRRPPGHRESSLDEYATRRAYPNRPKEEQRLERKRGTPDASKTRGVTSRIAERMRYWRRFGTEERTERKSAS